MGFWTEVAEQVRKALQPPYSGFFAASANSPLQGVLQGNRILLVCANDFTREMINKPEILETVGLKASAILGRKVSAVATDRTGRENTGAQMEKLLQFGRAHSDIFKIKENNE